LNEKELATSASLMMAMGVNVAANTQITLKDMIKDD
jgi:hypothetical protein